MICRVVSHVFLAGIFTILCSNRAVCQNPESHWQWCLFVEQTGFAPDKLKAAREYHDSLQSPAFMIVQSGKREDAGMTSRTFRNNG